MTRKEVWPAWSTLFYLFVKHFSCWHHYWSSSYHTQVYIDTKTQNVIRQSDQTHMQNAIALLPIIYDFYPKWFQDKTKATFPCNYSVRRVKKKKKQTCCLVCNLQYYSTYRYINHAMVILLQATKTDGNICTCHNRQKQKHLLCIPCVGRWIRVRLVM